MEKIFACLLGTSFIGINLMILLSDIKEKRIPNTSLLFLIFLLPFWYLYIWYFHTSLLDLQALSIQGSLTLFISFLLFHFGFWGAGDAKYLFLLSLFFPHGDIISFIGNISLLSLIYLGLYFIWFWSFGNISKKKRTQFFEILEREKNTFYEKIKYYRSGSHIELFSHIINLILIFIVLRLLRIYFFDSLTIKEILTFPFVKDSPEFIILLGFILLLTFRYSGAFIKNIFHYINCHLIGIQSSKSKNLFLISSSILFMSFIMYEYIRSPEDTLRDIFMICSYYFAIFLCVKALMYIYKISFIVSHQMSISIDGLKKGDILEYKILVEKWGKNEKLGFIEIDKRKKSSSQGLLSPDPAIFFQSLRGPIDEEQIHILKQIHTEMGEKNIYISKVFSYSPFIFFGFLVTLFFGNTLITRIIESLFTILFV